jgi:hypothetical protein
MGGTFRNYVPYLVHLDCNPKTVRNQNGKPDERTRF